MSKKKSSFNQGDKMLLTNKLQNYTRIYNYYMSIALNRFKWNNLPPTIESRHIENALFNNGQALFFNDNKYGLICLPCTPCNEQNIYGDTLGYTVTGVGYSQIIPQEKGIRILENDLATPLSYHVNYYSDLLSQCDITLNMNLQQQRFPIIFGVTQENLLSMKNIYSQYSDLEPVIYVDETLSNKLQTQSSDGMKSINTNVPYLLDQLTNFKKVCQNELFTLLGINNIDTSKSERLLTDEVNANNGCILMSLDLAFKNRQLACEKINKMFGLNVSVEKTINNLEYDFIGSNDNKEKEV